MSGFPRLHSVALATAPEQAWRNGGGTTRELLAWPQGAAADAWRVRVSVAHIAHSGPFSAYSGVQRWFAVLAGAGVRLQWGSRSVELAPGDEPLHFDGADAPGCTLLQGPTLDLNLMLRGGGRLQPALAGEPWHAPGAAWRGVYARSALRLHASAGVKRLAADTLGWAECDAAPWRVEAEDPAAPLQAWWLHLEGSR